MNRPNRKPLNPDSVEANGKQGSSAKGDQASSERQPIAAGALAQCLMLHVAIVSAQRMMARMATYPDWSPDGLATVANLIDQASGLVAAIIARGGAQ